MESRQPFEGTTLNEITVAVFGLGKMGLPLAAVLADHGATVRGVDIDPEIVEAVNAGETPIDEPEVPDLVSAYAGNRLTATTDGATAAAAADAMITLVPTVLDEDKNPHLDPLLTVGETISEGITAGDLVITESTVPPGTTAGPFRETVESSGLTAGTDFALAHCPERTSSGRVVRDLTESYPKIVGGIDAESTAMATALYQTFNDPGVYELPSTTAAEAVKVFEGVYRDVNIALANELAKACEQWGLDAVEIFDAANSQPYCDIHTPGCGVGGHCIPVYPYFVIDRATDTQLLETARTVNDGMPAHTVDTLAALLGEENRTLTNANILLLGLTYRAGVRETRYAPAIEIIKILRDRDAVPLAHDPLLTSNEIEEFGAEPVSEPLDVPELDGVMLITGHEMYRRLDLEALRELMRTPVLVDGRDFFGTNAIEPFTAATVGDGSQNHPFAEQRF